MVTINHSSIEQKLNAFLDSNEGRMRTQKTKGFYGYAKAYEKSIPQIVDEVDWLVKNEVSSSAHSSLSPNAASSIGEVVVTGIETDGDYLYINFEFENKERPSLQKEVYGYIDNIAALLNNGVGWVMGSVAGEWHGEPIHSRRVIPATYFLSNAVMNINNKGKDLGYDFFWARQGLEYY